MRLQSLAVLALLGMVASGCGRQPPGETCPQLAGLDPDAAPAVAAAELRAGKARARAVRTSAGVVAPGAALPFVYDEAGHHIREAELAKAVAEPSP